MRISQQSSLRVKRRFSVVPATWFSLRDFDGLAATYGISAVMLVLLYPACLWYRRVKAAHPKSILRYL